MPNIITYYQFNIMSQSRFTVSRDTTFIASIANQSKTRLERAYDTIDRRKSKMTDDQLQKFDELASKMMDDYNKIVRYISWYIKDRFSNYRYGLVPKMRRQGRLWSESNPEGITELYFRWAPKKDMLEELGFMVDNKYQKPDDFTFHFNTLAAGGCWKKNHKGEEFFDNHLFLEAFRQERISVPEGVSALAVIAKRALSSSFIKVSDVSDKSKSKIEMWEIRLYYKKALLDRMQHAPQGAGAGSAEAGNNADETYEEEIEADSGDEAAVDDDGDDAVDDDDGADAAIE